MAEVVGGGGVVFVRRWQLRVIWKLVSSILYPVGYFAFTPVIILTLNLASLEMFSLMSSCTRLWR